MRRWTAVAAGVSAAAAAAFALAACDATPPADLYVVMRTGTIAGAKLNMRVTDDGGVYCNHINKRHEITSKQLIQARAIAHLLNGDEDKDKQGLDQEHVHLRPGAITSLSYSVRSQEGTVSFSDTSPHQPQAFYQLAELTRQLAKGPCGLPR